MDLLTSLILVAALANLFFGIFVLLKNPNNSINRSFGFFAIITGFWVFVNFLYEITLMEIFLKSAYSLGSLVPISAVIWIYFFENTKITIFSKTFIKIAILIGVFFFAVSYINNYIIETENLIIKTGEFFLYYAIYVFFVIAWVLVKVFVTFAKSSGFQKEQSKYILFGLVASGMTTIIVSFILPFFNIIAFSKLDSLSSLFFIGFSAYALVRHRLFNIRIILTELLVFAVGAIILIDLLTSKTLPTIALKAGILIAFSYLGYQLIKSVYTEIQRRQEIEKIDKAKSEFISIASHQLRTPLTAVKGYISMILEGVYGKLSGKQIKPLENVYYSNERLIKLVNDLLNLSRLDAGKIEFSPEPTSLEEMVSGIVEQLKINAERKGLYMKMAKPEMSLPKIMVDQDKLRQVVLNIVDNAIKYTKEGGITIELKKLDDKERIRISDTGEGMTKHEIDSLFQMFSRATAGTQLHAEGAGLGLYVAKQFVEMHGGKIWAESLGKGKGSTFIIQLPIKLDLKLIKEKTKIITKAPDDIF